MCGLPHTAYRSLFTIWSFCSYTLIPHLKLKRYMAESSRKSVVLGVTGGIAAYKAAQLTRDLQRHGIDVQVVMTEAARGMVTPATFQALSGKPVYTDMWEDRKSVV